jgi:hypothetical protein
MRISSFVILCLLLGGIFIVVAKPPLTSIAKLVNSKEVVLIGSTQPSEASKPLDQVKSLQENREEIPSPSIQTPSYLKTPIPLKAVYLSAWTAGSPNKMNAVIDLINRTELNAVVIDVKDSTGVISWHVSDEGLKRYATTENRIRSIEEVIKKLHDNNIYVIARIAVFQDPAFARKFPEHALHSKKNPEKLWLDKKKLAWLDVGSREVWDYALLIAQEARVKGFDEANFDYIRFPSDGDLKDILYPYSEGKKRSDVVTSFFSYVKENRIDKNMVFSADIFGLTTTDTSDLGIGQLLESALDNFDYISPMVYPSHFADGTYGIAKPAEKPYEIISIAMKKAVARAEEHGVSKDKLRPWLQDFDLGARYTPEMVRAQIQATYDSGLTSWMLWDPANSYTEKALLNEENATSEYQKLFSTVNQSEN